MVGRVRCRLALVVGGPRVPFLFSSDFSVVGVRRVGGVFLFPCVRDAVLLPALRPFACGRTSCAIPILF